MQIPKYFYFRIKTDRKGLTLEIEDASDTDVAEVVRCRECKYRYVDGDNVRFNLCLLNHNKVQSDDWYCADGERKGGDE